MSIEEIIRRLEFISDCIESRMSKSVLMGAREIIAIHEAIALLRAHPDARPAEYIEREAAKRAIVEAVDAGLATTSEDLAEIIDELPGVNMSESDTEEGDDDGA